MRNERPFSLNSEIKRTLFYSTLKVVMNMTDSDIIDISNIKNSFTTNSKERRT